MNININPILNPNIVPNPDPNPNLNPDPILNHQSFSNVLTFSTQNVRSMNISTKNDITQQKVLAICKLKTDFIFLSDMRLNSTKQISAVHDLEKQFFFNGYRLIHNSMLPSRGVGILVSKKFDDKNFEIINTTSPNDCNSLILQTRIHGNGYILAAIYGPNHDNEVDFYVHLKSNLQNRMGMVIIGGDWNATLDNSDVNHNLDTVNMRNIPSLIRSNHVIDLCNQLELIDPFRNANPDKKEYTFIPSSVNENNRSRLDFFLIGHQLCNPSTYCTIPHCLTTTFFDHKPVLLSINGKRPKAKSIIKDTVLNSPDLPAYVKASIFECYLLHSDPAPNHGEAEIQLKVLSIGRVFSLLKEIFFFNFCV